MIINSISMKNFQCYFGEHEKNTFKFKNGLNLIIGDNGGGKSKLFDAFYWVLYDQIFDSETREFSSSKYFKEKLISDKAKKECKVGDDIDVEVILVAKTSWEKEYRFTRIFKAKKTGENEWDCKLPPRLLIDEYKVVQWASIESKKHDSILNMVIPKHLKPYMWFQGEQVDNLMDFTDKSTLNNAVNLLSNITIYDELIAITKRGHETAAKNFRTAQNNLIRNKGKSQSLNTKLKEITNKIDVKKSSIEKYRENFEIAKNKIEELISKIDDAKIKAELKKNKEYLEKELKQNDDQLSIKYNGLHQKMFTDYWVLKKSQKFFKKYSEAYKKYSESHNQVVNSANAPTYELPIDIPQPIYVDKMLKDQKCFVCNRDAIKGSEEYEFIETLLTREDPVEKKNIFKHDCEEMFSELYNNGLSFQRIISSADRNISAEFNTIQDLQNKIRENKSAIEDIKSNFEELIEDDKSEDIVKSFRVHETNREQYQSLLNADEKILERSLKEAQDVEADLEKLVVGKLDKFVEKSNVVFSDLFEIATATRDEVFHNLIVELENQANILFNEMTERNHAITGKIKLKRLSNGKYIPEIVGSDGYILGNPNDSNIVLVKLSLIMAIIMSRAKWSDNYSLILDAPTSKMAENYTQGFYDTIGENFTQSIVTTYDFINEDHRQLLQEFNLGNVYTVESHFPNNDSSDRADLEIVISRVQL